MKFYYLTTDDDPGSVGVFPQSTEVQLSTFNEDVGYWGPLGNEITPPEIILEAKAKVTNVIILTLLNTLVYLVCDTHFLEFIGKYHLDSYTIHDIKVYRNNKVLSYKLFHLSYPRDEEVIDYKSSSFRIAKAGDWRNPVERQQIQISSYENYKSTLEVMRDVPGNRIVIDQINLNFSTVKEHFIRLETPGVRGFYISEHLKKGLEASALKGFKTISLKDLHSGIRFSV